MQNPLKNETEPVIRMLHNANIRTVMITGDNILTAISVAHDCGMVGVCDQILLLATEEEHSESIPKLVVEKTGAPSSTGDFFINFDTEV